jgi:murein DD-endopeptidase MepM/ murein hydrolase activator NlpD
MRKVIGRGCCEAAGIARFAGLVLLVAACTPRTEAPAPVLDRNAATTQPEEIEVRRGQTLSGIAHAYHVPMQVLAEANHLSPPYRIETGQTLIIPVAGQPAIPPLSASLAALPPAQPEAPVVVQRPPEAASFDGASRAPAEKPPTAEASPAPAVAMPPPPAPAAPAPQERAAAPAQTGGMFLWPVRGRVLAGYGSGPDGTHNDGINIAAPRGAPVEAVDAGVVAYAGNELRGYGNLLLVKHPNGWISAYAHCDLILVKRGDKVARGQVIARVGSTGNVSEPQLHFELRRGSRAVDPREFLAPVPTATSKERSGPG